MMPSPQLVPVQQGDPPPDPALALQPGNPAPARRLRQTDPVRDIGRGQRSVRLQQSENLKVGRVKQRWH